MTRRLFLLSFLGLGLASAPGQLPENLVVDGVPPIPSSLRHEVGPYLEFRTALFQGWHPARREMLITTRFADTPQLHVVAFPGGARRQLTFLPEPVASGSFRPGKGDCVVFSQDTGGGEFYQLYRYDPATGTVTLLTDGKSRNSPPRWSNAGKLFAYTSTRRNGRDSDLYLMDPSDRAADRRLVELAGGGWSVTDWSPDDRHLLVLEYLSINESRLYLVNAESGTRQLLTPETGAKVAWGAAQFAKDGRSIFVTTDRDSEFLRLCRMDFATRKITPFGPDFRGNVESFDLSPDGGTLACVCNEDGRSRLRLLETRSGRVRAVPSLPAGVISSLKWHSNGRDLAFNLASAQSPNDVYSLEARTGRVERWTESETGGLNPRQFVEPELVKVKSFDGLEISALVYRPDARRFPGPRPVLVNIHGGPEAQARPIFQARNNYYLNELGIAIVYPNVRGSDGFGKTFLTLDNGLKREDSVRDIGAILGWVRKDRQFDPERLAVIGGSYGGFMVLASMIQFGTDLRCGVDVVGISNFLTFLRNTQDYRRDLRRVEYGDERDPAMAEFLGQISPTTHAAEIRKPLFVVQGRNDPRVPVSESEQMVKAIRERGGQVWYLMAKDEGHGFGKKANADFQFLSTILFLREYLLK